MYARRLIFLYFLPLLGLLASGQTTDPQESATIREAPLRGPEYAAFPSMGWVNQGFSGIRAAATIRSVAPGEAATLLHAPDGGYPIITLMGSEFSSVTNRWGSVTNWQGVCFWVRGCGTPSYATLQWGQNPIHEVLIRTDTKHWRKVHIPWDHWVPRILPSRTPTGPLRIRLDREPRKPSFTVSCVDPLSPATPRGRSWNEMRPYEAKAIGKEEGLLVKDEAFSEESVTGLTFLVKHAGHPVYGQVSWLGALEEGKSFLVSSNFWSRVTVPYTALPRPDRDPPIFRIGMEPYRYTGVWAVFDRLHLYQNLGDEVIQPVRSPEPEVNLPASTWIKNGDRLADYHAELRMGRSLPRILVITDTSNDGAGLSYLGASLTTQLSHNAWHRLTRNVRRHFHHIRSSTTQEVFLENLGRWKSIGDSMHSRQQGLSLHVLHSKGIMNFMAAGGLERAKNMQADVVIIAIGTQDLDSTDDPTYRKHLQTLISGLESPRSHVVLSSPIPVLGIHNTGRRDEVSFLRRSLQLRGICAEIAQEKDLIFVDLALALLHRGTGFAGSSYMAPGLLNHYGHQQVAQLFTGLLTDGDPLLWNDLPEPINLGSTGFNTEDYLATLRGLDPTAPEAYSALRDSRKFPSEQAVTLNEKLNEYIGEIQSDFLKWKLGIRDEEEKKKDKINRRKNRR